MIFRLFVLLGILTFSLSSAIAVQHKSARCDDCGSTQYRNLAVATAGSFANNGITIYIGDFDKHILNKYFVLSGNPLSPVGDKDPLDVLIEAGLKVDDITGHHVVNLSNRTNGNVSVISLQLTAYEADGFGYLDWLVNLLESMGISTRHDTPRSIGTFDVPTTSGYSSAFSVIRFPARTRELGRLASNSSPLISDSFKAIGFTGTIFEAVDLNFSFEFVFADGSSGLWTFDARNELDAIPGTFQDSNGNNIPGSPSDVPGLASDFDSDRSPNLARTMELIGAFGIPITITGGGGVDCRLTCTDERCTVTCRIE